MKTIKYSHQFIKDWKKAKKNAVCAQYTKVDGNGHCKSVPSATVL